MRRAADPSVQRSPTPDEQTGRPRRSARTYSAMRAGYRRFRHSAEGILLVTPLLAVLIGLLAYPVISALVLSLQSKLSGSTAHFIGLANYVQALTRDSAIGEVLVNTVVYAVASVILKTILGLVMALILNESHPRSCFSEAGSSCPG